MSSTQHYCARCLTTFADSPQACPNLACGKPPPKSGWGLLLGPGDLLDRHYKITRALAVGGAGLTYLAQEVDANGDPQPPDLAIKVLYSARASGPFLRRLSTEAQILQEMNHEHIVQCKGFVHRAGHEPYLVTLFEQGGALSDHIERVGPLPPRVAAQAIRQILLALDVAHQRGVVHRDLKPDNVLLRAKVEADVVPHCLVTDYGIAKVTSGGLTSQLTRIGAFIGTPEYAAPEQFQSMQPTPATDVFAAGGVLHYLLTTRPPIHFSQRGDIQQDYEELLEQLPPKLDLPGTNPDEVKILQVCIDAMMAVRPEERWTVGQLLGALAPLINGSNLKEIPATLELTDAGASPRSHAPVVSAAALDDLVDDISRELLDSSTSKAPADKSAATKEVTSATHSAPTPVASSPGSTAVNAPNAGSSPQIPSTPAPFVPPPITSTATKPPPAKAKGSGKVKAAGGFMVGMGVAGIGGVALVVVVLLLVGGVGGAWYMGYLGGGNGGPTDGGALEVKAKGKKATINQPLDLLGNTELRAWRESKRLKRSLKELGPQVAKTCGVHGFVAMDVIISADGQVRQLDIDEGYLHGDKKACVERELAKHTLPRKIKQPARLRAALRF